MWGARFQVHHLLRITVIGRYDEGVACLLTRFIDRTDGCISVSDGFDGCLKDAGMADLCISSPKL